MNLQILDLDGSLAAQASLRTVAPWTSVSTLPLSDLGPRLRLWSRNRTMDRARERIAAGARPEPTLSLLGSGDFHHLAVLLMEQVREPITIVHIDNHPDWEGIGAWGFDFFLSRRLKGESEESVIKAIETTIKQSDEWKLKHKTS